MYKYTLDRSSKKFRCPGCTKKTLVRYINNESKNYLEDIYGRCDRESKCGYFNTPAKNQVITPLTYIAQTIRPNYLDEIVILKFCNDYENNNLVNYLLKHFPEEQVVDAIEMYFLGSNGAWNGATIFWQIDNYHNIRTGKTMLYDRNTGKRIKKPYPHINWMHKVLQKTPFVLQQCLFGLHLIKDEIQKRTICIVESEKTAIVMSIVLPSYIWMATGAKTNLKLEMLLPIKQHKIILYPDKTEFNDWNNKTTSLVHKNFNITCSPLLEKSGLNMGADLVDFLSD